MGKYDSYVNAEGIRISKATGKPVKPYRKLNTEYWTMREDITVDCQPKQEVNPVIAKLQSLYTEEELKGIIGLKEDKGAFELINIVEKTKSSIDEGNTGILIASDFHIEETVKASTVLGLNEFNIDIAEKRVKNYFANAIYMVKKHSINNLVVGLLGDFIGGYIHDELAQTNRQTARHPCKVFPLSNHGLFPG